ncbi:hypothetical protein CLAFUW4_00003 [Fulvia fulva]|uniref:Uncharacterized protein n=1 Tax=Passalora fulva TaxID=5499 RepID=A0A9Q8L6C7_PASFU|nr:uncharacterized protein CLAFUR5_00002 [Fulvia fulva]KAK4635403.1 hypothetical protein CLAFUR4_00003 [Fulvia fulva]KAK4638024.1 hypothetical protein CLAFUR0_00003 [Fulvia fulva]UJO11622.1 hypothetical protein CLAFUR5_00002 [Fulvia fulva]WPV09660.1 hypothetical protein CLAFUW4_00003 [Fulvia fulva]WPV23576.1 hypothetical protein CLAFUW7_00003 [Fulvia fulva]
MAREGDLSKVVEVALILEELGVPHEQKFLSLTDVDDEFYLAPNPNGRVPPTVQYSDTGLTTGA